MIRHAISCDICGAEKKETNHWFVAYEHQGELRVSGWNPQNKIRPGAKHLCGQTCMNKLVVEFMGRDLAGRVPASSVHAVEMAPEIRQPATDTSLTSSKAYVESSSKAYAEIGSSARLIPAPLVPTRASVIVPMEVAAASARVYPEPMAIPLEEPPRYASRNWRAEAWERERERERDQRGVEHHPDRTIRRRSS